MKLRVDDGLTWEEAKENRDAVRDELIKKGADAVTIKRVRAALHTMYLFSLSWCQLHPVTVTSTEDPQASHKQNMTRAASCLLSLES